MPLYTDKNVRKQERCHFILIRMYANRKDAGIILTRIYVNRLRKIFSGVFINTFWGQPENAGKKPMLQLQKYPASTGMTPAEKILP